MNDLDTAYRNMMKVVDSNDADVSITSLVSSAPEENKLMQHWTIWITDLLEKIQIMVWSF